MYNESKENEMARSFETSYGIMSGLYNKGSLSGPLPDMVEDEFEPGKPCERWYAEITEKLDSMDLVENGAYYRSWKLLITCSAICAGKPLNTDTGSRRIIAGGT